MEAKRLQLVRAGGVPGALGSSTPKSQRSAIVCEHRVEDVS